MQALTKDLAAVVASADTIPRVIRQFTALFLVTPAGDIWRIFDSGEENGATRLAARHDESVSARIFLGSGPSPAVRVYRFLKGEDRSINAERLFEQLAESRSSI